MYLVVSLIQIIIYLLLGRISITSIGYIFSKTKILSEYDQEIPQSQYAVKPMALRVEPHNNHENLERQPKQSNQSSLPHQDDCITRMDIK